MYSRALAATLSLSCVIVGFADVTVREWSGISDTKFRVINPDPNDPNVVEIRILESDNGTFSFEAFYTGTNNAADIQRIESDPSGVTGTVRVKLAPDPNYPAREYGAATVKQIDLTTADTGEIAGILISGHLATTGDALCDNITGDVTIAGNMATGGDVVCDDVTGDIYIGGDLGKIGLPHTKLSADTVTGAITIAGKIIADDMLEANTLGDVSIYSHPMQGTIQIYEAATYGFRAWNGDPNSPALEEIQNITVDASVTGTVTVKIAYDAGGNDGASDLWEMDLTGGSGSGNLGGLRISGNLATTGDGDVDIVDLQALLSVYGKICG